MLNGLAAPAQLWVRYFNCGGTDKLALIAEWLTQVFFSCAKSRLLVEIPDLE